jgi:outer membrane immunogenic protein
MNALARLFMIVCAGNALALAAVAGPEAISDKEMKQVAPLPPPCNWQGFYLGLNAGGQFGHSEDADLDGYNLAPGNSWGYGESGFTGGAQVGYNWQWRWLVLGPEFDGGYMDLHGAGIEPNSPAGDTRGESDSDFFTTLRGRIGVVLKDKWLVYGTGGAIAVHYTMRVIDNSAVPPASPDLLDGRETDLVWGYTVGGGIERMINCHWSIKAEYLYFNVDPGTFTGHSVLRGDDANHYDWSAETTGHILRLGLNYRF